MVVWQGITEGGTAVPVQITEEGKVVAIGEAGPEGPEGPRGPEGPEGPAGQAEWPPNPIEGAFLVWLNGEPTWYTEQPVPTPPGTQGPIVRVDENSFLIFDSDVDQNIFFKGVEVYAVHPDGSNWDGEGQYDTSRVWSNGFDVAMDPAFPASNMFDANFNSFASTNGTLSSPATLTLLISGDGPYDVEVETAASSSTLTIDGVVGARDGNTIRWNDLASVASIVWNTAGSVGGSYVRVNGKILLDPLAGPYPTGQISTVAANSALLSRVQGVWTEGLYMKADASAQAAWLYSKTKKGAPRGARGPGSGR